MCRFLVFLLIFSLYLVAEASPVPGLVMGTPTYTGRGCPPGSVSIALSPDTTAVSVLFDRFYVNLGAGQARRGMVSCEITIPFQAPGRYRAALVMAEYRGFVMAELNSRIMMSSTVGFYGANTLPLPPTFPVAVSKTYEGPVSEDIYFSSATPPRYSGCGGGRVYLKSSIGISATTNAQNDQLLAQIDSEDLLAKPVVYRVAWERCR